MYGAGDAVWLPGAFSLDSFAIRTIVRSGASQSNERHIPTDNVQKFQGGSGDPDPRIAIRDLFTQWLDFFLTER